MNPVVSPEKYFRGVHYSEGQLVYLTPGNIYQATQKFRSSWREATLELNLLADVEAGFLVLLSSEALDALEQGLTTTNELLEALKQELANNIEEVETELDLLWPKKYAFNFEGIFGTSQPSKTDADNFLAALTPPVNPAVNISFRNTNTNSETAGWSWSYYPHPTTPGALLLRCDEVDTVLDVSNKVDKTVAGVGGRIVENFVIEKIDGGLQIVQNRLSLEDGSIIQVPTDYSFDLLDIASKQNLEALAVRTGRQLLELRSEIEGCVKKSITDQTQGLLLVGAKLEPAGPHLVLTKTWVSVTDGRLVQDKDLVHIDAFGLVTLEVLAETVELLNQTISALDNDKVDKTVAGSGGTVLMDASVLPGQVDVGGVALIKTNLSLETGAQHVTDDKVSLSEMGAISKLEFEQAHTWKEL